MKVMAILNITPDSFSDGGSYVDLNDVDKQLRQFIDQGATIIDVGGESTRPGATPVSLDEELSRVLPVVEYIINNFDVEVSIDTYKPEVAKACLDLGVKYVNDVRGSWNNIEMYNVISKYDCKYVLMHCDTKFKQYNVLGKEAIDLVFEALHESVASLVSCGFNKDNIVLDPGIGFYKSADQSLSMLKYLDYMREMTELPLLLGTSRKSSLGIAAKEEVASKRDVATAVTSAMATINGFEYVRVHNVFDNVQAIRTVEAIYEY